MNKYRIWDTKNNVFIDLETTDKNLLIDPLSGNVVEVYVSTGELDVDFLDELVVIIDE